MTHDGRTAGPRVVHRSAVVGRTLSVHVSVRAVRTVQAARDRVAGPVLYGMTSNVRQRTGTPRVVLTVVHRYTVPWLEYF